MGPMAPTVLAINPGSTSTKCALYRDTEEAWKSNVSHKPEELSALKGFAEQLAYRSQAVRNGLSAAGVRLDEIGAVVGRGGLLRPLEGGVYEVNERMKDDLSTGRYGSHASNFGALIADAIASEIGVKAYIVDPVVVDELSTVARLSGIPEIPRRSIFHALNQKATARKAARQLGRAYTECTFVVAHMGGGTSVGVHVNGRVVDVNNALDGDGPFAIERAGTVPAGDWMRWVLSHQHDPKALQHMLTGKGGLVAWLGTSDFPAIEGSAAGNGSLDRALCADLVDALCYQVSKSITGLAAYTAGAVDAVVLTGGLAHSQVVVSEITRRVRFLGPVLVFPGENELEALATGARDVLLGEIRAREYEG
jgi:butyrate kinase